MTTWATSPLGRRHAIETDELGRVAACGGWRLESWETLRDAEGPRCPSCVTITRGADINEGKRGGWYYGERRQRIERLTRLGMPVEEVAAMVGVSLTHVHQVAYRHRRGVRNA